MKANGVETSVSSKESINGAEVSTPSIRSGVGTSVPSNSIEKNGTEVPAPGYKQTKVGVIPEDWEVVKLEDITTKISDGLHSTPKYEDNTKYFFINGNNLVDNKIYITKNTKSVSYDEYLKHKRDLTNRTILMSINGTIGNLALYNKEDVILGKSACYINLKYENSLSYIFFQLASSKIKAFFVSELTGSTIKNLSLKTIKNIRIPLPSLNEQQKIAQILSTWDDAISKQETLIKAKETLKKGLMQKLLSGEVRFGEFGVGTSVPSNGIEKNGTEVPAPSGWEEVRLGNIGKVVGGGTPSTENETYWNGDIFWFTPTEIKNKYITKSKRKITELGLKKSSAKLLPINTLLLTTRATIGDVSIAQIECTTNQGFQSIIVNNQNSFEYVYYWILQNKKELIRRSSGSTFIEISKKEIEKIPFLQPTLKEQQKIAQVLTTVDQEIELLKKELETLKEQKRGLMQRLLSGEVRV